MSSFLAIFVVVGLLAFGLFVVGPFLVWVLTAFDQPRLHTWEYNQDTSPE